MNTLACLVLAAAAAEAPAYHIDLAHWFGSYTQRSAAARYTGGVPT